MDIRNNLNTNYFSPYTSSTYPSAGEGANAPAEMIAPARSHLHHRGDSLMAMSVDGDFRYSTTHALRNGERSLVYAHVIYWVMGAVSIISILCFVLFALQPLLVILFTLGDCFSDGFDEWLEFTCQVLEMGLLALGVGILTGAIAWLAHLMDNGHGPKGPR